MSSGVNLFMVLQTIVGFVLIAFAGWFLSEAFLGKDAELAEKIAVAGILGLAVPALVLLALQAIGVKANEYAVVAGVFVVCGLAGLAATKYLRK